MIKLKKKQIITVVCFLLAVLLTFAAIPYRHLELSAIDTSKDNEDALKAKLEKYKSEGDEIRKKLEATQDDLKEKENEKQYLDSLMLATQNEIDTAIELREEYTQKITDTELEIENVSADIEEKYQGILERLSFIYEEENYENYLEMIVNADTLSDALLTIERIGSMLDFDRSMMSELSANLTYLENERQALSEAKTAQEELEEQLKIKEGELEEQKKVVDEYIATLQADEAAYNSQLEKAEAAEKEAGEEIEKLLAEREAQRRAANTQKPTPKPINPTPDENNSESYNGGGGGGGYVWPVPSRSYISVYFGSGGHRGIDIPCSYGASIVAAKSGTVVQSTWHYSWGYYVLIDHGDNTATLYAHNSQLLVSAGESVSTGETIAKAGNTGNSFGNHCHFEFMVGGKLVNPLSYVSH